LIARAIKDDPAVASVSSFIGVDGSNATLNTGRMQVELKPTAERDSITDVMTRLEQRAAQVSGMKVYLQASQDLTIDARVSRTQYQLSLSSLDAEQLREWVPVFVEHLAADKLLAGVTDNFQFNGLQTLVKVDRDAAARHGITMTQIDDALYNAFGQRLVSTIFTQSAQYRVVMEVAEHFR